jgi:hypothetical protein
MQDGKKENKYHKFNLNKINLFRIIFCHQKTYTNSLTHKQMNIIK